MGTSWTVVDKLMHELGSVRAVIQEIEAQPGMSEDDVVVELRSLLDRAADTVHLVVGGDEDKVAQAWRCIAEAQEVGKRARLAVERSRGTHQDARTLRERTRARVDQTRQQIDDLEAMRKARDDRRAGKSPPQGHGR